MPRREHLFYVEPYSKYASFKYDKGEGDEKWEKWYTDTFQCPKCGALKGEYREHPPSIRIPIHGAFRGCSIGAWHCPYALYHESLIPLIKQYLPTVSFSPCVDAKTGKIMQHYALQAPASLWIDTHYGPAKFGFRHCICGRAVYEGAEDSEAILERDVQGKPMVVNNFGNIYVHPSVIEEHQLLKVYPDMRLYRYKVVPKSLNGWVLPGDPEWDGTLRKLPPKTKRM